MKNLSYVSEGLKDQNIHSTEVVKRFSIFWYYLKKNPQNQKITPLENLGIIDFISASDSCATNSSTLRNLDDTPKIRGDAWNLLRLHKPKRQNSVSG